MPHAQPEWWLPQRRWLVNLPFFTSVILWIGESDHSQNNYKYINSLVQQCRNQPYTHTCPCRKITNHKVIPCSIVGRETRMPHSGVLCSCGKGQRGSFEDFCGVAYRLCEQEKMGGMKRIWNEWHLGREKGENWYICSYCLHLLHVGKNKHLVTCGIRNGEQKRGNFLVDLFDNNQTNTPRLLPVCQALDLVLGPRNWFLCDDYYCYQL